MMQVRIEDRSVVPDLETEDRSDCYIAEGRIGRFELSRGCHTWHEMLRLVAAELWRCGEAERTRVTLKAGGVTVRQFLRGRFGIATGAREFWHRETWTPDRADLHDFLRALRNCGNTKRLKSYQ